MNFICKTTLICIKSYCGVKFTWFGSEDVYLKTKSKHLT